MILNTCNSNREVTTSQMVSQVESRLQIMLPGGQTVVLMNVVNTKYSVAKFLTVECEE